MKFSHFGGIKQTMQLYGIFQGLPDFPEKIVHEAWVGVI